MKTSHMIWMQRFCVHSRTNQSKARLAMVFQFIKKEMVFAIKQYLLTVRIRSYSLFSHRDTSQCLKDNANFAIYKQNSLIESRTILL